MRQADALLYDPTFCVSLTRPAALEEFRASGKLHDSPEARRNRRGFVWISASSSRHPIPPRRLP